MNRYRIFCGAIVLAVVFASVATSFTSAQIPYNAKPTAAPAPRGAAAGGGGARSGRAASPQTFNGVDPGVVLGEIMPLIAQEDDLSLPIPVANPPLPDNVARIWLHVPPASAVWFNGFKTNQMGEVRYFVTPPLIPGTQYAYLVRVRWMQDGRVVEAEKKIQIHAGERVWDDFIRP